MNVLNIIDNIYENSHFTTALIASVILLVILFVIVLFIGIRDARKDKIKPKMLEEDVNDISFDIIPDVDKVKEDVTFEMPVLTKNLENFKKNLEEEILNEETVMVRKSNKVEEEEKKIVKVLDMDEIKDTSILEVNDKIEKTKIEPKKEPVKKNVNVEESIYDLDDDF